MKHTLTRRSLLKTAGLAAAAAYARDFLSHLVNTL